ncbi:MAG TPA: GspE/PulE family protein [Gaiellaceae bacterium]|nr:GspE/PulE family protein [Gaiellaceae bacterium]
MSIDAEPILEDDGEVGEPRGGRPQLLAVGTQPHDHIELDDFERARQLAEAHRLPLVDLAVTGVSPDATKLLPLRVLERVVAVPYAVDDTALRVALSDPENVHGIDELRLAAGRPVEFAVTPREDVLLEIRRLSRANEALGAMFDEHALEAVDEDESDLEADDGISDGPVVRLVNSIIYQAAEDGASDVHFEPQEDALVVRNRIDGVLTVANRVPRQLASGVTTRVKVLAKLDIAERRKPQDGRITLTAAAAGRTLDIRVATLPTVEGESVVMRLLDKSKRPPTLSELGFSEQMRAGFEEIVARPTGALLVTGPTGSGKSTTLYAALAEINRPEINVITVEDPVEYRLGGISQVQINVRAGLTFATVLRSILRSDPDVVMVGEIRDVETAKTSIEAALTGHFVLSSLHTNDAPGALTRLNEMGVEPFLTSSAVSAVVAQRLARRLCVHCAEDYEPSDEELEAAHVRPDDFERFRGGSVKQKAGCGRCNNTGFKGRIGIYQLLPMSETVARLAARGAAHDEIAAVAAEAGMRSLWDDGLDKVAEGVTTFEELARVVV